MRCGKAAQLAAAYHLHESQPARMRCGKDSPPPSPATRCRRNPRECAVAKGDFALIGSSISVATRANALWQRGWNFIWHVPFLCRNPRECAVAKLKDDAVIVCNEVATRANALWQSADGGHGCPDAVVATRANALWQRSYVVMPTSTSCVATRANALWQRARGAWI